MSDGKSLSRRQVAQGAAWSIPAVAMAASAPALAASGSAATGFIGSGATVYDYPATTRASVIVDTRPTGDCSYRPTPSGTTATFQNTTVTFWLISPNYTFTNNSPAGTWTNLVYTPGAGEQTGSTGITLYPYQTTYVGSPVATSCGPTMSFSSNQAATGVPIRANQVTKYRICTTFNGTSRCNPIREVV